MPHQIAVTVKADVRPGRLGPLVEWLDGVEAGGRRPELFPFERLPVHFARFVVLEDDVDINGAAIPPSLTFISDVDAPLDAYLDQLARLAGDGLDGVFGHCEGYPDDPNPRSRAAWMKERMIPSAAKYVNTPGRSVEQVHDEQRLRAAIQDFLDDPANDWSDKTSAQVREAVQLHVASHPDLAWARAPAAGPGAGWRLREAAHLGAVAAGGLVALPAAVVAAPLWLLAVRLKELGDTQTTDPPDPAHVAELTRREDLVVQNQFAAVGHLKPGLVREVTVRVVLFGIDVAARHVFNRGNLAGVKTIHFARWTFIDDGRRLLFTSNYDGSLENYMDDFIDKIAWSLNAAFSNGVGYPRTKWLIGAGANDEQAFKNYIRLRQLPSYLWYSAYPDLTAVNIASNAGVRTGLRGSMDGAAAHEWVRQL